ncbi:MAG TPA: GNAT family N-acetyltransferase [bacterium]
MTDQPTDTLPPQEEGASAQETLTIREFQADDIDGLFFLEQRCYGGELAMKYPQLRALLKDPAVATLVVVGEAEGQPRMAAALLVKPEAEQGRLMVVSLNVDPDYRRVGLGRELIGRAQRVAAAQKLPALAMPVEAENVDGAAFLKAMGFTPAEQGAPFFVAPEDGHVWCLNVPPTENP